jgi:hypothetical protein
MVIFFNFGEGFEILPHFWKNWLFFMHGEHGRTMGLKRQDNSKILCWLILFGTMPKTL